MSLKQELKNIILERGVVTLKEIEDYCHSVHKKTSNAERRLRELRGVIEPIYNDKKTAIIAYKPHVAIQNTNQTSRQTIQSSSPQTGQDALFQISRYD